MLGLMTACYTYKNKVFEHCLRDLSYLAMGTTLAELKTLPEDNGEDEEKTIQWRQFCGQVATGYGN